MKKLLLLAVLLMSTLGLNAEVWLVNVYPGSDIYELEGHSALRISDTAGGDYAVSWGQFDFNSPNFVYRFVKGETDYAVAAFPWEYFEDSYRRSGRRMVAHRINIDSVHQQRLVDLIAENLQPENRVYRYNYVKDNCATRPLRMLELALGDSIILPPTAFDAQSSQPVTFRNIMRHYHSNYPWYQFGIDLALGSGIDCPLTPREQAFAPSVLDTQMSKATVGGRPLTSMQEVLVDVAPDNALQPPTPWYLTPLAVCWAVFAAIFGVCVADLRRGRVSLWLQSAYFAVMGLAGCIIAFLIFVSVHEATSPNWLFAWLNPLCLFPAIFIWLKSCRIAVISYHFLNFAVILILCLSWPWLGQSANPAFLPLVLADMLLSFTYIRLNYKR